MSGVAVEDNFTIDLNVYAGEVFPVQQPTTEKDIEVIDWIEPSKLIESISQHGIQKEWQDKINRFIEKSI